LTREYLAFAVELRNLLVHNHGVLEGRWLKRLPSFSHASGNKLVLEFEAADQLLEVAPDAVARLDAAAIKRLGVPGEAVNRDDE
jgi:hypothetical protein